MQKSGLDVFYVCADGWLWTQKGGYFGSDIKFKKDIKPLESSLDKINKLAGVRYKFKDDYSVNDTTTLSKDSIAMQFIDNERFGFIAQEVEKVLPEVVKIMPDKTKAIAYMDIIPVIVEGMKEQNTQIKMLQKIIDIQQIQISELKSQIENCCEK